MNLTFKQLREANLRRLPVFKNSKGEPAHSKPDGSDWSNDQWFQALIGEVGEYANFAKKYIRGDIGPATFLKEAKNELADVQIYLDILAFRCNVDINIVTGCESMSELRDFSKESLGELIHELDGATVFRQLIIYAGEMTDGYRPETFGRFQFMLDRCALTLGIDLSEATREKFNAVSDRIGCDVYL